MVGKVFRIVTSKPFAYSDLQVVVVMGVIAEVVRPYVTATGETAAERFRLPTRHLLDRARYMEVER